MKIQKTITAIAWTCASSLAAADDSNIVNDSTLNVLLRNAYFNRDYKDANRDRAEWGQAAIFKFSSGFTPGPIQFGIDSFGLFAARLDGGSGKSGHPGIDFFKQDSSGNARHEIAKGGAALKALVSKTKVVVGDQIPNYPVLAASDTRLLPEAYSGTSISMREIDGLEINAARFTSESRKSATGRDSGKLNRIDLYGADWKITDKYSVSLYRSNVKDYYDKIYGAISYKASLSNAQTLGLDLRGYQTHLSNRMARLQQIDDPRGAIWSLAVNYSNGPHSFILAYQKNDSDFAYPYGGYQSTGRGGDGGSTIYFANSYWSDFNGANESSVQLGYGFDFARLGVPGLTYRFAYVDGRDIRTSQGSGSEREIFNQFKYTVPDGSLKGLTVKLRSSVLRASQDIASYNVSGNEFRAYIEYPINVF